jgi:hypothetical protein
MGRENTIRTGTSTPINTNISTYTNNITTNRLASVKSNNLGIVISVNELTREIIYAPLANNISLNKKGIAKPLTLNFQHLPKPGYIMNLQSLSDPSISDITQGGKNTVYYDPNPVSVWQSVDDNKVEIGPNISNNLINDINDIKNADIGIAKNSSTLLTSPQPSVPTNFLQTGTSPLDLIYKGSNIFLPPNLCFGFPPKPNDIASQTIMNKNWKLLNNTKVPTIKPLQDIFYKIQVDWGCVLTIDDNYGTYRTALENEKRGGASSSPHLSANGIDIKFPTPNSAAIKKLIGIASFHGALGLGIYADGDTLHIDIKEREQVNGKTKYGRRVWGSGKNYSGGLPPWAKEEFNKHLADYYRKNQTKQ